MFGISFSGLLAFLNSAVFMFGYITNNTLFPEPLTQEEEKIYLEKYKRRG